MCKESKMAPPKVGAPGRFVRVTRQSGRKKERMAEPEEFCGARGCYNIRD
jgi:hypothetical protein